MKTLYSIATRKKNLLAGCAILAFTVIFLAFNVYEKYVRINALDILYENGIKAASAVKAANIQLALSVSTLYDLDAHFDHKDSHTELSEIIQNTADAYLADIESALPRITTKNEEEKGVMLQALLTRIRAMQIGIAAKLGKDEYQSADALRQDIDKIKKAAEQAYNQSAILNQLIDRVAYDRGKEWDALYADMVRQSLALLAAAVLCGVLLGLAIKTDERDAGRKNAVQTSTAAVLSADEKEWWAEVFAQNRKKKARPKREKNGRPPGGSDKNAQNGESPPNRNTSSFR